MRIVLTGINYAPEQTGIAPYTTGMAAGLRRAGHYVRVITGVPHYPQWRNFTGFTGLRGDGVMEGIPVRRVRHYIADGGTGLGRILQEVTFGIASILESWRGAEVAVTVSPALIASALVVVKARLIGIPVGVWVQDLYSSGARELGGDGWATRVLCRLESWVLQRADGVLVIHDRFARAVVEDLGVPAQRVTVSRNWSHLSQEAPRTDVGALRQRLFGDIRTVALHTGNMGAKQGLENVVEAAREAGRRSADVAFGLVGDGSRRADLMKLGEGISQLVFVPSLPDDEYRAVLHAADILIVNEKPGLLEMAVPSKLTSYFLQGKPVVAATEADSATAGEIRDAGAGVVVEPGRPVVLLEAIEQIVSDELAHELGENARRYATAHLTEDSAIDRIDRWIATLAAPSRRKNGRHEASSDGERLGWHVISRQD